MEFESRITGPGSEHFEVIETFDRINDDSHIYKNYLDINNMYRDSNTFLDNALGNDFEGRIIVRYQKNGIGRRDYVEYLMTASDGVVHFYGSEGDNEINDKTYSETKYIGASGSDRFEKKVSSFVGVGLVQDYEFNDKIVLERNRDYAMSKDEAGDIVIGMPIGINGISKTIVVKGSAKNNLKPEDLTEATRLQKDVGGFVLN
jgi:hypothetical protein